VLLSKECREFADECVGWAKTARSEREYRIFLQMAETWLRAAVLAERRENARPGGATTDSTSEPLPNGALSQVWE
jgi:hypothetical protein